MQPVRRAQSGASPGLNASGGRSTSGWPYRTCQRGFGEGHLSNETRRVLGPVVNGEEPDPDPAVLVGLQQEFAQHDAALAALQGDIKAKLDGTTNRD